MIGTEKLPGLQFILPYVSAEGELVRTGGPVAIWKEAGMEGKPWCLLAIDPTALGLQKPISRGISWDASLPNPTSCPSDKKWHKERKWAIYPAFCWEQRGCAAAKTSRSAWRLGTCGCGPRDTMLGRGPRIVREGPGPGRTGTRRHHPQVTAERGSGLLTTSHRASPGVPRENSKILWGSRGPKRHNREACMHWGVIANMTLFVPRVVRPRAPWAWPSVTKTVNDLFS